MSDKLSLRASIITCDNEPPYTELSFEEPASSSNPSSPCPPPFSSLYFPPQTLPDRFKAVIAEPDCLSIINSPAPPFEGTVQTVEAETKAALPQDTKGESSSKGTDDEEPPPPYNEGSSPLEGFTYVMAVAGGAASIITQVQQGGAAGPGNALEGLCAQNSFHYGSADNVGLKMLV